MTITLEVPEELEAQLLADAQASGVPLSDYLRDFIVERYREDLQDTQLANARSNDPRLPMTSRQMRKNLGLDS